ncbi:MAG: hypothetical protein ACOX4M_09685 [Acetivibrionales bacterium]
MRYTSAREYPITKIKKCGKAGRTDFVLDISLGMAAGILGIVFLKGFFWGYCLGKKRVCW